MAITTQCCYFGLGSVYMAEYNAFYNKTNNYMAIGNVVSATVTADSSVIGNIQNKQTLARGFECNRTLVNSVTVNFELSCHKLSNLQILLGGNVSTVAGGAQTELKAVNKGEFVKLNTIPSTTPALLVKGPTGTPTYVAGTDYIVIDPTTIYIPITSTIPNPTITSGVGANNLQITYTSQSTTLMGLFAQATSDYRIYISVQNALSDISTPEQSQIIFEMYRASIALDGDFQVIASGDDANTMNVIATLKPDNRVVTSPTNPFSPYGIFGGAT